MASFATANNHAVNTGLTVRAREFSMSTGRRERSFRPGSLYPHANGQRALLSDRGSIGLGRYQRHPNSSPLRADLLGFRMCA